MLLKNKLIEHDEDKGIDLPKDNDNDKASTEGKDKDIASTDGKDKDIASTEGKDKDIASTEGKDKDITSKEGKDKDIASTEDKDKDIASTEKIDNTTTKTSTEDKSTTKIMDKTKDILDKINNKIDIINKSNSLLAKLKVKVTKKIKLIYEIMTVLQDEIYSDDSWLRLVELNNMYNVIEEALNVVWKKFYGKNRINPEMIKIDKHKDIDGYVSKLTDIINNKIELLNRICGAIDHAMSEIKNETNIIDEKIHKLSEMDNDTLLWINDRLNGFINQSGRNLKNIAV